MRIFALLATLVIAATACQSGPSSSAGPDILIASDFPTSYPDPYAIQREQIIQLAVHDYPRIGNFKLGYAPFDDFLGDGPSPAKAVQNVKQMIADARVLGIVGPWTSNIAYATIPVTNPASLVIVSPASTSECITLPDPSCGPGKPPWKYLSSPNNFFRLAAPEPVQGRALARYINESIGIKRVAAFNELGTTGALMIKEFATEFARAGGKVVFRQDLKPRTTYFKTFLDQAKAAGAQGIYAVADGGDRQCAARAQMTKIFPKDAYFMGADGMYFCTGVAHAGTDDLCIKDAVGNGEGMLTATSDVDLTRLTDPASVNAVAAFRKAYPKNTDAGQYTFAIYDAAHLLINAIADAVKANGGGIPTRAQVLSAVAGAHFKGLTGTYSFDAKGDALSPLMSIYSVQNGRWVLVKQFDASAK